MPPKFITIDSPERLEALIAESATRPIFLFKHSNSCGISLDVLEQLDAVNGDIHIVTVQNHRNVSNLIAERLAIRHASPQAFVIRNGVPTYHATHYGIDADAISAKLHE